MNDVTEICMNMLYSWTDARTVKLVELFPNYYYDL